MVNMMIHLCVCFKFIYLFLIGQLCFYIFSLIYDYYYFIFYTNTLTVGCGHPILGLSMDVNESQMSLDILDISWIHRIYP